MRQPFCPCAFLKPLTMIRSHIGRLKRRCQFRRRRCPIQRCRSSICEFNNPKGQLLPGMFAHVALDLPMGEQTVIPDTAVLRTGTHNVGFIDRGDGYLTPAEIELGSTSATGVLVDASILMVENGYRHLSEAQRQASFKGEAVSEPGRQRILSSACHSV
jgi:hypothetical protein